MKRSIKSLVGLQLTGTTEVIGNTLSNANFFFIKPPCICLDSLTPGFFCENKGSAVSVITQYTMREMRQDQNVVKILKNGKYP